MYENKQSPQNAVLIVADAACLAASYLLSNYIVFAIKGNSIAETTNEVTGSLWLVFITYLCVFLFFNMNQYFMYRDTYEELVYIVKVNVVVGVVLAMVFYAAKKMPELSRGAWVLTPALNVVLMYLVHCIAKAVLRRWNARSRGKHLYVVTTTDRIERVLKQLKKAEGYAVSIAILDDYEVGGKYGGFPVVADEETMFEFAREQIVDEVYISIPQSEEPALKSWIKGFEEMGIIVHLNVNVLEEMEGFHSQIDWMGENPVVSFAPRFFDCNKLVLKRLIDIAGALAGLAITAVVTVFLAPAIKLDSPGPLFFKQKRVGRNGRYFYIYKFRSMYQNAEAEKPALMRKNEMKGAMFKLTDDPRVTRVGRFIRATSLDELPQFWNILKGDMSLVGTRPPTVDEFKLYENRHKRRLSMKPGLTGMWQVSGRSDIEDFEEVVRLDCYYIDNWCLQLDAKILLKTVVVVFKRVGSR